MKWTPARIGFMATDRFKNYPTLVSVRRLGWSCLFTLGALFLAQPSVSQEPYRIGSDDVIEIKFWQDPTLNASIRIREDGKITLDIIGEIIAAGLTESELQDNIVRLISRVNRNISQATVRVVQYNNQRVFVTGEALKPGKFTFERIPDLWTLINEAGGPTPIGDLSRVRIIRGGAEAGKVEEVDVAGLLASGNAAKLPKIRAGDTIEILKSFGGVERATITRPTAGLKNVFYIIGEVKNPGAHPLEANVDVLDAIALAGGPSTTADLKTVRVLTKDGPYSQTLTFNAESYAKNGKPVRYILRPEDTIILPGRGGERGGVLGLGRISDYVALASGIASVSLLLRRR